LCYAALTQFESFGMVLLILMVQSAISGIYIPAINAISLGCVTLALMVSDMRVCVHPPPAVCMCASMRAYLCCARACVGFLLGGVVWQGVVYRIKHLVFALLPISFE
jgi:hypothetical protein